MAEKEEPGNIERIEKDLEEFKTKRTKYIDARQKELDAAKAEYDKAVQAIEAKYEIEWLDDDIARYTYILRIMKGEVDVPAYVSKTKSVKGGKPVASTEGERVPFPLKFVTKYEDAKNWNDKVVFALKNIKSGTNDDVIRYLSSIDKTLTTPNYKSITLSLSRLSRFNEDTVKADGKQGRKDIYRYLGK